MKVQNDSINKFKFEKVAMPIRKIESKIFNDMEYSSFLLSTNVDDLKYEKIIIEKFY